MHILRSHWCIMNLVLELLSLLGYAFSTFRSAFELGFWGDGVGGIGKGFFADDPCT